MSVFVEHLPSASAEARFSSGEIAEVLLLLPQEQAVLLEQAARQRGLTVGQMLRRVVQTLLNADGKHPPGCLL